VRLKKDLSVGEWAVLALLCERPTHGYAIRTAMAPDGDLGQIWSLGQPHTYRALGVLREMQLVEVAAVAPGDSAPPRTELKATDKAQEMVSTWLDTPELHVRDLRSSLLLKIHLLRRRGRPSATLLTAQRDLLASQAKALGGPPSEDLVRHWRLTMTEAALRFVEETLEREREAVPA
jgi:PadR family transcriptional regulator AphA